MQRLKTSQLGHILSQPAQVGLHRAALAQGLEKVVGRSFGDGEEAFLGRTGGNGLGWCGISGRYLQFLPFLGYFQFLLTLAVISSFLDLPQVNIWHTSEQPHRAGCTVTLGKGKICPGDLQPYPNLHWIQSKPL